MMFDDFRNARGLPPSSSHHGWDFRPHAPRARLPVGWGLAAAFLFSGIVWAAIIFKI